MGVIAWLLVPQLICIDPLEWQYIITPGLQTALTLVYEQTQLNLNILTKFDLVGPPIRSLGMLTLHLTYIPSVHLKLIW